MFLISVSTLPSDAGDSRHWHLGRLDGGHFAVAPQLRFFLIQCDEFGIHSYQVTGIQSFIIAQWSKGDTSAATATSYACIFSEDILEKNRTG